MVKEFIYQSTIPTSLEETIAFHENKDALKELTMPPIIIQVNRDDRGSMTDGEIEFKLWFGPFPVRWLAKHEPGPIETSFKDIQVEGPMAFWEHEHIFEPVPGGIRLIDKIHYAHKGGLKGLLTRLLFDGIPLRILFMYRHWKTHRTLVSQKVRTKTYNTVSNNNS